MSSNVSETRDRKEALSALKEERKEYVQRTLQRVKDQNRIMKKVKAAMAGGAFTIPEIALASGISTEDVLWYVTALKTYGRVEEGAKKGEYFSYRLVADEEKEAEAPSSI